MDTAHRGLRTYTRRSDSQDTNYSVFGPVDFPIIFFLRHYNIIIHQYNCSVHPVMPQYVIIIIYIVPYTYTAR